jgi:hypothetical protein
MRKTEINSFDLNICPKGNMLVTISVDDWGLALTKTDNKARFWGLLY